VAAPGGRTTALSGTSRPVASARPGTVATSSDAIIPALSTPSGFGSVTSTSKTRLEASADGATRVILPRNCVPGTASTVTFCGAPSRTLPTSTSGTPNTTLTARTSPTETAGVPAATSDPTSIERLST
jgi:hypothetical protein